jgi:DNA-binding NarL/FixJ family response regulator
MEQRKSILIIDDHPLFREGLKSIISRDRRYQVVDEAGSTREGIRKVSKIKPDLVLVDISLPDQNGFELVREIRRLLPNTHIMIISMHSKVDYIAEAFRAGATGYIVKESAAERLLQGLENVLKGEFYLDSSVSNKVIKKLIESPVKEAKISDSVYGTLTPREQEIMRLLAEGLPVKKIADKLFISPKTVENHRYNIMNKLSLKGTHELIRYATKLGLIDVDLWKE